MTESAGELPLNRGRRVTYPDEEQIAFWRRREEDERRMVANAEGEAKVAHLNLADSYAELIAQAARQERRET